MVGNLFTDYFLTDGIKSTSEWRTSEASGAIRYIQERCPPLLQCLVPFPRPERGRHGARIDPACPGTVGMG